LALFLQDDWQPLENLQLNLGVRYERAWYKNNDGDTHAPAWKWGQWKVTDYTTLNDDGYTRTYHQAEMAFENMIAPRIGAVWDIKNDGSLYAIAFWGRYYNPFNVMLPLQLQPFTANVHADYNQSYIGPPWHDQNRDGIPDEDYFFYDSNWAGEGMPEPTPIRYLLDPDIKPEYTDEFSVGLQWECVPNISISYEFVNRKTRDLIEDAGIFTDEQGNVTWTYLGGVNWDDPDNPFFAGDSDSFYDRDPLFDPKYERDSDSAGTENEYYDHRWWITNPKGAKRDYQGHILDISGRFRYGEILASYTWSKSKGSNGDG